MLVFVRASREPLTSGVPALYTKDGYWQALPSNGSIRPHFGSPRRRRGSSELAPAGSLKLRRAPLWSMR
jgi:hypothetical protein